MTTVEATVHMEKRGWRVDSHGGAWEGLQRLCWVCREFQREGLKSSPIPSATLEVATVAQTRVPLSEGNTRNKVYFVTKD